MESTPPPRVGGRTIKYVIILPNSSAALGIRARAQNTAAPDVDIVLSSSAPGKGGEACWRPWARHHHNGAVDAAAIDRAMLHVVNLCAASLKQSPFLLSFSLTESLSFFFTLGSKRERRGNPSCGRSKHGSTCLARRTSCYRRTLPSTPRQPLQPFKQTQSTSTSTGTTGGSASTHSSGVFPHPRSIAMGSTQCDSTTVGTLH